jgi:hypothetical protein
MVAQNTPQPMSYRVTRNGEQQTLSYQQMFHAGYHLLLGRNYAEASRVFDLLSKVTDRGPRAGLMLAFCQAQQHDYIACSRTLNSAFEGDDSEIESKLHGVFVYWACGLLLDARHEWENLIEEYPDLPSLSLLLADLLAQSGNQKQPPRLWRLAIRNDRPDGAIGQIAARELTEWSHRARRSASK